MDLTAALRDNLVFKIPSLLVTTHYYVPIYTPTRDNGIDLLAIYFQILRSGSPESIANIYSAVT